MFLGELGLRGLKDIGGTIVTDVIPIRGTKGYTISLVYERRGNQYTSFFQTNIPQEIWNMEESDILRKTVLDFINPKGKEFSLGLEEDTKNVALRFLHPPQDNLLSLLRV